MVLVEPSLVRGVKNIMGAIAEAWLDELLSVGGLRIEPVTAAQAALARAAHSRFGKGTRHAAGLNFGDCFSCGLTQAMKAALLFIGEDFARADVLKLAFSTSMASAFQVTYIKVRRCETNLS